MLEMDGSEEQIMEFGSNSTIREAGEVGEATMHHQYSIGS
jgi:hypothetical protein